MLSGARRCEIRLLPPLAPLPADKHLEAKHRRGEAAAFSPRTSILVL